MFADLLTDFWAWIWGGILDLVDDVVDRLSDGVDWVVGFLRDWLESVYTWLADQLGPVMEKLTPPPGIWSPLVDGFELLSYWVPLNQMFVLVTGFVAVIGTIRLMRWIKSFISTIDS